MSAHPCQSEHTSVGVYDPSSLHVFAVTENGRFASLSSFFPIFLTLLSIHTSHAHSFLTRVCRTQEGEENSNLMKAVKAVSCTRLMDQLCFTAAAHRKDFNIIPLFAPHSISPFSSTNFLHDPHDLLL